MADERVFIPCDGCGARSTRDYVNQAAAILSMCEHHSNRHRAALRAQGFQSITDNDDDCDSNVTVEAVA